MSETVTIDTDPLKGTVWFTRKISDGNYGGSEFGMSVQFDIPKGAEQPAIIDLARDAALTAKSVTYEQLGLKDEVINGVVMEIARQAFPGSVIQANDLPADSPAAVNVAAEPPYAGNTTNADEKKANTAWAKARYEVAPGDFYDNRAKKASGEFSAKSPDLKHKTSGIGIWLS